jgi:hypothetical protein
VRRSVAVRLTIFTGCVLLTMVGLAAYMEAKVIQLPDGNGETLKNAINSAKAGDIIVIPPGSFTFDSKVIIDKPLCIVGSGKDKTAVYVNGYGFEIRAGNVRIEGMKFVGNLSDSEIAIRIYDYQDFVIYNCQFVKLGYRAVEVKGNNARGVISNCEFIDLGSSAICVYGVGSQNWLTDATFGTENAIFVEDSYFNNIASAIVSNQGSRYVFRYNHVYNTHDTRQAIDAHGFESGHPRGSRSYEIYNNYTDNLFAKYCGVWIRGGDGVIFNNAFNKVTYGILLSNTTGSGTSFQYPALDQTRMLYAWNNTVNGKQLKIKVREGHDHLFQEGRDFFNHEMPGYEPYTYPHPLVESTAPVISRITYCT